MSNKNILIIGGAGYIGSHMVKDMLQAGYDAIVLDNLSKGHRDAVPNGIFYEGDLGNASLLDKIFSSYKISAVMHFAAYSLVGESVQRPLVYYRNNISQTIELLDAMFRHDVQHFIFSSTAAVYGEPIKLPIREDHPCQPSNAYGATKLAVERMLADCSRAYGLKYVSLRYFNAAGADISGTLGERHDPETHLIPLILQVAGGQRENIQIFGTDYPTPDGTCLRDYVHVSDLTQAHLLALESLLNGGDSAIYNLGNSKGLSVQDVIKTAREVTGHSIPVITSNRRAGDPAVLVADSEKIRRDLGWQPRFENLKTIIETAWAWHRKEIKLKN